MEHEIEAMWMEGMRFNALVQEHTVVMDAPSDRAATMKVPSRSHSWSPRWPGCAGMDVVALLRK